MFTFDIVSTISITNACDGFINEGDILYGLSTLFQPEANALFYDSEQEAYDAAQNIIERLEGNAGFNEALASAKIVIRPATDKS